ncbi:translocation/assembly module TamB domain-containing protein [Enterovibrio coralii]|uniref:translocation/assembly module TamB domain-containing protein n=1 Tax=Enterovibrio coralii TaxID=294935 RepID=UPI001E33FBAF|nr:translocation/assembly module TamB domain-containing protein [Enterovibrio coralii]
MAGIAQCERAEPESGGAANGSLEVSPDMTLKATPKQVDVTGNVSVPWGRIIVESLPPSAVQVSSDLVILNDELKPISEEEKDPITINAQIKVNIGDDVRLEAFGLKTNLEGKLDVQSNKKGPSVSGDVNLVDGTYRSFGQDLLIKKGLILFNGPPEQPYLQVEAIRNPNNIEDDVEAGIRVTGPADAPEVQVFSQPAMPQANALSYLTRGRNLDSESDGNAMTSMLIGLGLSQSGKLVGQIGEAFGVQDLTVDTAGSGNDEKVEVSGYILPGLQVKYGVGIFTSLPEFTVRYRLIKDLYLEAVSGADNAVDLLYQFSIK